MKILRSMGTVGGFTLGSRVFGFLRDMLVATLLGAGTISDALVIAMKLPSLFRRLMAEGAFSAAFIPIFTRVYTQEGEQGAKAFAEEVLNFMICFLIIFTLVIELFLPVLIPFFAPGLADTPERMVYAVQFSRITFPFIIFISLYALYSGILNSFDRFVAVASSSMISNIFVIGFVLALTPIVHQKGYLFATAILGCGIVQMLWVIIPTHKIGFRLRLRRPCLTPQIRRLLKLMTPVAISSGMHQLNVLIGITLSSNLPIGGISYLYYAERLNQLPTSTIGTALATVMLPLLARQIRSQQVQEANESQNQALELALLLTLPATIGLICLAEPIIITLFKSGAFTLEDARQTSYALIAFAVGLPAYILVKLFSTVFYAHEDTKTPLMYAIFSVVLDIALAVAFLKPFGHVGLAMATAAAAWFYALGLGLRLYRGGQFVPTPALLAFLPRLVATSIVFSGILWSLKIALKPYFFMAKAYQMIVLSLLVIAGIMIYGLLGAWFKAIDFRHLKKQLAK